MGRDYHRQLSVAKENGKHRYILTVDHHSPGLLSQTRKDDWRNTGGEYDFTDKRVEFVGQ